MMVNTNTRVAAAEQSWCSEVALGPTPTYTPTPTHASPALSGFKLNLTPHTWPLGARMSGERVKGTAVRECPRRRTLPSASSPTKGEIQLQRISVRAVEYQSLRLTENIFPPELKAASINLSNSCERRVRRRELSASDFAGTSPHHSIFNLWYILLWSLFSMFLSRTVKRAAGLMYGRRSITYIVPQDNQWVCGSPQRARQRQIDGPLLRPYVPRDTSSDSLQIGRRGKGCSWIKADTPQGCSTHNCHLCRMNSQPKWR